jgi:hypothetical protein
MNPLARKAQALKHPARKKDLTRKQFKLATSGEKTCSFVISI